MDSFGFWVAAVIAAALVGRGQGRHPGGGMLGVPVLALVIPPVTARRGFCCRSMWSATSSGFTPIATLRPAGAGHRDPRRGGGDCAGWATARVVPEDAVTALVGMIGMVFCRQPAAAPAGAGRAAPGRGGARPVLGRGHGVHQLRQPFRRAALAGLYPAAGPAEGGLRRHLDDCLCHHQRGQADPYWHLGQLSPANLATRSSCSCRRRWRSLPGCGW